MLVLHCHFALQLTGFPLPLFELRLQERVEAKHSADRVTSAKSKIEREPTRRGKAPSRNDRPTARAAARTGSSKIAFLPDFGAACHRF